ncbi:uncharacterized protein LOC131849337, partial [Achroia grisella]|uniref:uncharacterized protein LOC131849337 n=1 Tax=Achroia grisella TaxID=688607 RepID=UPI0027D297CA
ERLEHLDAVIKRDEQRDCTTGNENEEDDNWMSEVFIGVDEGKEEIPSKRPKYDVLNLAKEDQTVLDESLNDSNMVTLLANLIHKEEDEDRAFFKSITPAVKTLSQDAKLEFRIMVMKILKGLKKKQGLVKREPSTYSDSE